GHDLPCVDAEVENGGFIALKSILTQRARGGNHFPEILLVLDPIQLHLKMRELLMIDVALFEQSVQRAYNVVGCTRRGFRLEMIQLQVHSGVGAIHYCSRVARAGFISKQMGNINKTEMHADSCFGLARTAMRP